MFAASLQMDIAFVAEPAREGTQHLSAWSVDKGGWLCKKAQVQVPVGFSIFASFIFLCYLLATLDGGLGG